jgi:hypothetical protein
MKQINPAWQEYNDTYNEGGEGYNPHPKYIANTQVTGDLRRMVRGKMRTQAEARKFAANCLSGEQRNAFLAEISRVFGE